MSLGRNTVVRPVDFNVPTLQIPFDMLYGQMQQYQQNYDAIGQLESMMPKHLEKDTEWADRYRRYSTEVSNAVTNAFAEGNTSDAIRMMRNASNALASEWKPGGLAYALEERYGAYTQGIEQLQKAHEKDPTQMNFAFGKHMFDKSIGDLDYDYQTMKYNRVGTPNVYNYTSIAKRLQDEVKTIMPDVREQDIINGLWVQRLKEKGYSPERIQAVWQGVLNSPEIQQQIQVEAFNKVGALSDEEKQNYIRQKITDVEKQSNQELSRFKKLSDVDKQKYLQKMGLYNGAIDGKIGPMSKQAIEEYESQLQSQITQLQETSPDSVIANDFVVEPYQRQFLGYFGKETSNTLRANQVALTQMRMAHQKKLQEAEFAWRQQYMVQDTESGLYTPTQGVDITAEFTKQRDAINQSKELVTRDLQKLAVTPKINELYNTAGGNFDYTLRDKKSLTPDFTNLNNALKAFKNSGGSIEKFAKQLGITDVNKAMPMFNDLQENASDYADILSNAERVEDLSKRINIQQEAFYKEASDKTMDEAFNKYAVKGETKDDFVKSLVEVSNMSYVDMRNSNDPKVKRFFKDFGTLGTTTQTNKASVIIDDMNKRIGKKIKSGEYAPKSMPRFSMSGSNKKYGAGMISSAVKKDFQAGAFSGYTDFITGTRDKFTDIYGDDVNPQNIDPNRLNVEYDSGWGKPSYIITAYDTEAKKTRTFRVTPPSTHNSTILRGIEQEFAMAVNEGNLENAARAARFREENSGNLIDMAAGTIKPTNKNIKGNSMTVVINDNVLQHQRNYTSVYDTPYARGYNLEIVTYYDNDGKQKWATTLRNTQTNERTMVGKATKQGGLIAPKSDHKSISDMEYKTYHDALDNTVLLKAANEVPVDDIYSNLPKDLKGIGLGDGKVPVDDYDAENYDDFNNDDN